MPAWGGVLGGALTTAANAYLEGLLNAPDERLERRKKELSNEYLASQIERNKATAEYERRRLAGGGRPVIVKAKDGSVHVYNEDTQSLTELMPAPDAVQKQKDLLEGVILRNMERVIGGAAGPKPFAEWTPEELRDPRLMPYWDLLWRRSPLATIPGAGGDVVPKTLIPGYGGRPTTEEQRPAGPAPLPSQPAPPATRTPAGRDPGRRETPPPTGRTTAGEEAIKHWMQNYAGMSESQLQTELNKLTTQQAESPSPIILSQIEAIKRVQAARRGQAPQVPPAPAPGPEARAPSSTTAPGTTAPTPSTAPPTAVAPPPAGGGRPRNFPLTREQEEEEERKRRAAARAEDADRRAAESLDLSKKRLALDIERYKKAQAQQDEAGRARSEVAILRETREARGKIQAADESLALIQELRRFITPQTVGLLGKSRAIWQSLRGQLQGPIAQLVPGQAGVMQKRALALAKAQLTDAENWQAQENVQATQEGRAPVTLYIPPAYYDPRMRFIDFLDQVLAYSHARAIHGPGRLTNQNVQQAKQSLGLEGIWTSADDAQASIGYLEHFLKGQRKRAEAQVQEIRKTLSQHLPFNSPALAPDLYTTGEGATEETP